MEDSFQRYQVSTNGGSYISAEFTIPGSGLEGSFSIHQGSLVVELGEDDKPHVANSATRGKQIFGDLEVEFSRHGVKAPEEITFDTKPSRRPHLVEFTIGDFATVMVWPDGTVMTIGEIKLILETELLAT